MSATGENLQHNLVKSKLCGREPDCDQRPLRIISALCYFAARQDHCPTARGHGAFRRHALATCKPQAPGEHFREACSGEGAGLADLLQTP